MTEKLPPLKFGVGVFIWKNDKILLHKRKNAHGAGHWGLAGGHIDEGETAAQAAIREVFEETGIQIESVIPSGWVEHHFKESNKRYVTLFFTQYLDANSPVEPEVREPDKCEKWIWADLDNLPSPLFGPLDDFIKKNKYFIFFYMRFSEPTTG